jgi:hypothetical protein
LDNGNDTNNEEALRQKARQLVRSGKLPICRPDRVWGGRGEGVKCSICDIAVTEAEIEFELEFFRAPTVVRHHVHLDCFTAWERERDEPVLADEELEQSA